MESKLLHSIMHGELMPWTIDLKSKSFAEKIKALGNREPETLEELTRQVKIIVADLPDLVAWLNKASQSYPEKLNELHFSSELPQYHNTITKYYSLLISKEILRVFNVYVSQSLKWTNRIDIIYHTTILLRNLKSLTKQVNSELAQRGFEDFPDDQCDPIHFTLYLLKLELINLYFSIQEVQKDILQEVITLEDFYLLELNNPISAIRKIYTAKDKDLVTADNKPKTEHKINFGFKGKVDNLKTVITQLNFKVNLLNEDMTTPEKLLSVLTNKKLIPGSEEIHLNCETAIFRYIIDKFKPVFSNLKLISIANSKVFYSRNGTLITANNLSSSKIENPKLKDDIDKIF